MFIQEQLFTLLDLEVLGSTTYPRFLSQKRKMTRVSIIVPTCGPNQWYEQCLDSIHAQTYKDIELIVVDDSARTGVAAARNRGLALANGEYIAFCDDDDYLSPDAIERMVGEMAGVDMVVGSFRKFGEFKQYIQHAMQEMTRAEVAQYAMSNLKAPRTNQMLSGCWAKLYRRSLVTKFPLLTTAEDMAFNFDYLKRCERVLFIDSVVYHNRKRDGSLSTTFDENNKPGLFGFLHALRYVRTFLEEFYEDEEIDDAIDNSKVYHSALYFSRICQQTGGDMRETLMRLYP